MTQLPTVKAKKADARRQAYRTRMRKHLARVNRHGVNRANAAPSIF